MKVVHVKEHSRGHVTVHAHDRTTRSGATHGDPQSARPAASLRSYCWAAQVEDFHDYGWELHWADAETPERARDLIIESLGLVPGVDHIEMDRHAAFDGYNNWGAVPSHLLREHRWRTEDQGECMCCSLPEFDDLPGSEICDGCEQCAECGCDCDDDEEPCA